MIVGPNKGLFFAVTALMCSASLYAAESTAPSNNPLTRIFTGEPNRLTLPPDFPDAPLVNLNEDECGHRLATGAGAATALHNASKRSCAGQARPEPSPEALPETVSVVPAGVQAKVEPVNVGGTVRSH
jgi:hypothetical protein